MFRQSASRAVSNIIQDTGCPVRSIKYSALVKRSVYRSSYDEAEMSVCDSVDVLYKKVLWVNAAENAMMTG
ncbi:hypothetical protein Leryth_002006 [Lithospermum erythrorhizon]|nr:hypothetical protein Leryth_002006 [Lithospermum erythrorhizon]